MTPKPDAIGEQISRVSSALQELLGRVAAQCLCSMDVRLPPRESISDVLSGYSVSSARPVDEGMMEFVLESRGGARDSTGINATFRVDSSRVFKPASSDGDVRDRILFSALGVDEVLVDLGDLIQEEMEKRVSFSSPPAFFRGFGFPSEDAALSVLRWYLSPDGVAYQVERIWQDACRLAVSVPPNELELVYSESRRRKAKATLAQVVLSSISVLTEDEMLEVFNLERVRSVMES